MSVTQESLAELLILQDLMYLEYQYLNKPSTPTSTPIECNARTIKWYVKNVYIKKLGYTPFDAFEELAFKLGTREKYVYKYIALISKKITEICKENKVKTIDPVIAEKMIDALITRIALAKRSRRK